MEKAKHQTLLLLVVFLTICVSAVAATPQERALTPLQLEIEQQRARLSSSEIEQRRDALVRLTALHHPEASRAALAGLKDGVAIVRVTAAVAVLSLPADEAAGSLLPLLADKDEFVRQEVAYALGKTGSRTGVTPLVDLLRTEKKDGVRSAIVVALGDLADEGAVVTLSQILRPELDSAKQKAKKANVLVLRAAAHSLGQIKSRAGIPALLAALQDDRMDDDIRREAAIALGAIGDPSTLPALNSLANASDPYLSLAAYEAARRVSHAQTARP